MAYKMTMCIYKELDRASIDTTVKADTNKANIMFDEYSVGRYCEDVQVKFFMAKKEIASITMNLWDILEVGQGPITVMKFEENPGHYTSINMQNEIASGEKTLREVCEKLNPTLSAFLESQGCFNATSVENWVSDLELSGGN